MMDFARTLKVGSLLRYALWRLRRPSEPLALELRTGVKFLLRSDRSENNDYGVAYEVFVLRLYDMLDPLPANKVRRVVDLGGNVGFSVLHWLNLFPECTVETFEPNPVHVAQMRRNLALSGQTDRVVIHGQGAGATPRTLQFVSEGSSTSPISALHNGRSTVFDAEIVDVFEHLLGKRIDIMKIDIEGGEYELLADERFGQLDVGYLVIEWHVRAGAGVGQEWCEQRLASLGYVTRPIFTDDGYGMFWAIKQDAPSPMQ